MEQCSELLSLNNSLFSNCYHLKSIKLPQNITVIENGCFFNNTLLDSITIPDSVQIIRGWNKENNSPFYNTLKEIIISPNSKLTTIGYAPFLYSKITYIFIPRLVNSLDPGFIFSCNIERIEIDSENNLYKTDGIVVYKDNNSTLICVSRITRGVFIVPSYVTTLAVSCFRGVPITNITFPHDSMNFNNYNFGETNFVEFNCPSNMTSIPPNFFYHCSLLTTVNLSPKIQSIGINAFLNCPKLLNIELPPALTKIDDNAFSSCTSLKKLVFPPSLTEIGESVFSECTLEIDTKNNQYFLYQNHMLLSQNRTSLTDCFGTDKDTVLDIPIECVTIGKSTFYRKLLKKVTFVGNNITSINESAFESSSLVEIILPSSLCILGKKCFISCIQLTTVIFNGNSLIEIPDECFRNCIKLSNIILPHSITSIGNYSFYQCSSIGDIGIGNTQISNIGRYCFSKSSLDIFDVHHCLSQIMFNCFESSSVSNVTICSNSIPERCFRNCESLTSLTLNEGIVLLSDECFKGCTKLSSFTIPKSITTINSFAFQGCSSLTSVILDAGSSLSEVFGGTFADCDLLEKIICKSDAHKFRNGALTDAEETKLIVFIPSSKISTFVVPSTMKSIGQYAFMGSKSLVRVIVNGDHLTSIGFMSFADCVRLSFLFVPSTSLERIGNHAFSGCKSLYKCGSIKCNESKQNLFIARGIPPNSFNEICPDIVFSCVLKYTIIPSFIQASYVLILFQF